MGSGLGSSDLNLLVALQALLEEVNVTRAGDRLGMSQPTMSAALSRLRRQYDDELLIRVGRAYELTPLAAALLPQVQFTIPLIQKAMMLDDGFDPYRSERVFSIMMSDYVMTLLNPGLRARLSVEAPRVVVDYRALPDDLRRREFHMAETDFVIGPRGFEFTGRSVDLFTDRFVCVVDPANSELRDGELSLEALRRLPHARSQLGVTSMTPVDRRLAELRVDRSRGISAKGWLPQAFLVGNTDMVAIIPERLARRVAPAAGVVIVEPPFRTVEIIEALWWQPSREVDAGNRWLRAVVQQVAETIVDDT